MRDGLFCNLSKQRFIQQKLLDADILNPVLIVPRLHIVLHNDDFPE